MTDQSNVACPKSKVEGQKPKADSQKPRLPDVSKLPDRERQEMLDKFLSVLNQHRELLHFRLLALGQPERQLALFAALERGALKGNSAACPPKFDDSVDLLLCDILDVIDGHAELKLHGSYYGPQRYAANLLALGVRNGNAIPTESAAGELFATWFSDVSHDQASTLPPPAGHLSPASQEFGFGGELIEPVGELAQRSAETDVSPEVVEQSLVATLPPQAAADAGHAETRGIIRHGAATCGEQSDSRGATGVSPVHYDAETTVVLSEDTGVTPVPPSAIPPRVVRRGRPPVLDDMAKGRLLGLMSYGLSFRQAAAQLGIHHQTILNLMKRDEQFAQQVSEARLDAISQPLITVVHASRTNWRAAAWLAKFLEERRVRSLEKTPEERELEQMRRA